MTNFIFYDGPSQIDGQPIIGIATFDSRNEKTGAMVQTWIIRKDIDPVNARREGADKSICGGCKFRPKIRKSGEAICYVTVGMAPLSIYKSFHKGNYPQYKGIIASRMLKGAFLRLGSYGDPAAIPMNVWQNMLRFASGNTGYTHQWKSPKFAHLKGICMASCDSPSDVVEAIKKGWGTYRVAPVDSSAKLEIEIVCPASKEAGKKLTCVECRMCDGSKGMTIVIRDHSGISRSKFLRSKLPVLDNFVSLD